MMRKSFVLLLVVLVLLSLGVVIAAAQDDQPTPLPGHGMMGHGRGMMMGMGNMPGMAAVADALGMEADALITALQSGESLAEIAEAQGVELQVVTDAMFAAAETHLAELVAAGTLTQAQADEHLAYMSDHMAEMPMFSGAGCSMMGSMQGMGRMGGMMGQGRSMGGMMGHGRSMGHHN